MEEPTDVAVLVWARAALRSGGAANLRVAAGLSQGEVAAAVGVTTSAVSKWEAGQRIPRGEIAMRYARFLAELAPAIAFASRSAKELVAA